jgi:hypothetical protein
MKNDPFENELRGQPLRQLPADWRRDILSAAARASREGKAPSLTTSTSWWRTLFWPAPGAWAGLAAVWVAILGLHFLGGNDSPTPPQISQTSPARQVEYALREKHRLYVELLNETETNSVAEPPRRFVPRPRSEAVAAMVFV